MKRFLMLTAAFLLILALITGYSKPQTLPAVTESTTISAAETIPAETEGDVAAVYSRQIARYYTAISQQWDEGAYWDHEMSALAAYYYEGTPLENIGFAFMDLDGNGIQELLIGAILASDRDPLVFEIWTVRNGEPAILAQSGSHNRYYLQYAQEDGLWSVAYEAENGAANHAVYYLQLADGEFQVIQGIVFDAIANEQDPWFMAYDLDWDVSNDTPIDADTADAVMTAGRSIYAAREYIPYSQFQGI
jgi:hypothetical protein